MDFVDEEDVALLEVGEERREVAGPGDHRSRGRPEVHAELARDDLCQGRLAEAGRPDEKHVVERFLARPGGLDEDLEVGAGLRLADELGQILRPQRRVGRIVLANLGGDETRVARGRARVVDGVHPSLLSQRVSFQQTAAATRLAMMTSTVKRDCP